MAKIDFTNGAAPAAPAVGKVSLYTKGDKKIYIKDDAGLETDLTGDLDTGITQLTGDVTAGPGNGSQAATLATVNANVGSFTNASVTVNAKGLITAASSGAAIPSGALLGQYKCSTATTPPPSSGQIRYNNATQVSATSLYISELTDNGIDISVLLNLLHIGDKLLIQDRDDAVNYQIWDIAAAVVDSGTYRTVTVTLATSGGTGTTNFANNHNLFLAVFTPSLIEWGDIGGTLSTQTDLQTALDAKANQNLGNLTSPTAVNQHLIPSGTRDIGTAATRWSNSYINQMNGDGVYNRATTTLRYDLQSNWLLDNATNAVIRLDTQRLCIDANASGRRLDWAAQQLLTGTTVKLDWSGTDVSLNTRKLTSVVDPTAAQDAATKNYVDTGLGSIYVPYTGATANVDLGGTRKVINAIDPTNAQDYATKAYADTKASIARSPLSISITGQWLYEFPYRLTTPLNIEIDGVVTQYDGKTITNWTYTEQANDYSGHLLTLSFDDLEGVTGDLSPSTLRAITSLSYPALKYVGGNFIHSSFQVLTTLSAPELEVVGGSITPTTLSSLTTLSFPKLKNLLGSFTPASFNTLTTISCPELKTIGTSFNPTSFTNLATVSLPKLEVVGTIFSISSAAALNSLDLSMLKEVGNSFTISSVSSLATLSLPELLYIGGNLTTNTVTALASLSIPKLVQVGNAISLAGTNLLSTISAPSLTTVGGQFTITSNTGLTNLSLPALNSVASSFQLSGCSYLATFSLPAMTNVGGRISAIGTMTALTTISFPAVITYGSTIEFNAATNITSATIGTVGTLKSITGAAVTFSGCKLTQASVDAILEVVASLDGTNGTTSWGAGKTLTLSGGTNATPSAAGLVNKAIIQARGATVLTN